MKLRTLAVAALAAMTLASCSKEGENGGKSPVEGHGARLAVSLTMPVNTRDWDDDINATTAESKINTVSVYVFNALNGTAVSDGAHTNFELTDFNDDGNGKYTLKSGKNIKTTSGNVKVYVAANLPSLKAVAYATEALMLEAFDLVSKLDNSDATTGFSMFSAAVPITLAAYDDTDPTTIGTASANLDRIVSKVVGSTDKATYTQSWTTYGDVTFTYEIEGMGVYNEAIDSYLAKNATTKSTLNTFDDSALKPNATVGLHPSGETGTAALTGFYIGENTEGSGNATNGQTTYAMVATTVSINKAGTWNTADEKVDYTTATYGGGSSDVYVVMYQGVSYVTDTEAKAQDIANGLVDKYNLPANSLDDNIYIYTDGYVHFPVYLNREGSNDYNIGRNQFVHVKVNGVSIGDGQFPGYPGDPDDPEKPIDPTDPDPSNPDPKDPDDNVDPEEAALNVVININKWVYKANETILQ